jgi:hypothetical protein
MSLFKRQGQIMEKVDKLKNVDFRRMQLHLISHIKAIFFRLHNKTDMYFLADENGVI